MGDFITICFLYSRSMNIYGDRGNVIALKKRVEWRGKDVVVEEYNIGDRYDFTKVDLFFFGGGQDQQQLAVAVDLKNVGEMIKDQIIKSKAAMLAICGGLQLMGKYYDPIDSNRIDGTGLFDLYTVGGKERFIGNVLARSDIGGEGQTLVGFENHSGRTYVNLENNKPLAKVEYGRGNNGEDGTEGVVFHNAVGSYLHGSLLPKNPWLADWLIKKAFERKYGTYQLCELNDEVEHVAHQKAIDIARKVTRVTNISQKK